MSAWIFSVNADGLQMLAVNERQYPLNVSRRFTASYGAASVRYELIDVQTGIEIGEIFSTRKARPWNVYPWNLLQNFQATGQGSVILKSSAKRLEKDTRLLAKITTAPKVDLAANSN